MDIPAKPLLGRLEKVDLRTYWVREDVNFTPWLAEPENIKLLGDTIGIELEVQAVEKTVGSFRADILCKDTVTEHWVLIENQLERTNHSHLGQLLTYASGLNAVTIIWISSSFTDEHRASLDWLNRVTHEEVNFFGLEIELWRIGNSALAPKFNLVVQPNGWTKIVENRATALLNEVQQIYAEFWSQLSEKLNASSGAIKRSGCSTRRYMGFGIGRTGFRLYAEFIAQKKILCVCLYLSGERAKHHYHQLARQREAIEEEIGVPLCWDINSNNKGSDIYYARPNVDIEQHQSWNDYQDWLYDYLNRFYSAFACRVKDLGTEDLSTKTDLSENLLE
jgi:hypothetical protein